MHNASIVVSILAGIPRGIAPLRGLSGPAARGAVVVLVAGAAALAGIVITARALGTAALG